MSTNALVRVYEDGEDGEEELLCIYQHYDGYPEGLGAELRAFAKPYKITNGTRYEVNTANGISDFAAQLVWYMKQGKDGKPEIGNVYIYPPGTKDCGEEYEYQIRQTKDATVEVLGFAVSGGKLIQLPDYAYREKP
jgi:hypothetical protein